MFTSLLTHFTGLGFWGVWSVIWLLLAAFQIWMFIDAIRRGEWIWAIFIWLFPAINALLYYLFVYRGRRRPRGDLNCPARTAAAASRNCRRKFIISTRLTTIRNSATSIFNRAARKGRSLLPCRARTGMRGISTPVPISANACSAGKRAAEGASVARRRGRRKSQTRLRLHANGAGRNAGPRLVKPVRRLRCGNRSPRNIPTRAPRCNGRALPRQ